MSGKSEPAAGGEGACVASSSRRRQTAASSPGRAPSCPARTSRLRTTAVRSSSSTLMSLACTALQSGQLPTQLIWSVLRRYPVKYEDRQRQWHKSCTGSA